MIGRLLALAVLTAGLGVGMAGPAQASCCGFITADGVRIRNEPNTHSTINGLGYSGDTFAYLTTYETHEPVTCPWGGVTPAWAKIRMDKYPNVVGWVSACYSDPGTGLTSGAPRS